MSAREDEIRRVVAELDVHVAEVEARVALLKALLADDEVPGEDAPVDPEAIPGGIAAAVLLILGVPTPRWTFPTASHV